MATPAPHTVTPEKKKRRRPRGSGSIFKVGRIWWFAYWGADGHRVKESSYSERKGDAERQLEKRNGAVTHNLPIIKNAERLTFHDAAQAVIDDVTIKHPASLPTVKRRITKHLMPYFGGRRMASIKTADVAKYILHRQQQGIVAINGTRKGQRVADVSNAEINRELQTLKRIFNLAIEQERLAMRPTIKLLPESEPRAGFFEREQFDSVMAHLPSEVQPVVAFAYHTGWRVHDEVLPLEWRQVDFAAGEVRLDPGTTKNKAGRVIYMSAALRTVLEDQHAEHLRLKKAGHIVPYVFFREVAEGRGGEKKPQPIISFGKAWKKACREAGCPGRIPHDMRRTAVRNFVRAGIPQQVSMAMTGHKTASVFARYNILSNTDLREAAQKMNAAALRGSQKGLKGQAKR
jgi:integrase